MERNFLIYGKLFLLCLPLLLISCGSDDNPAEFEHVKTVVKGNVSDIERNINIEDFEVRLVRIWFCSGGDLAGYCKEDVASVTTDAFGNYEIKFDYIKDGKDYLFEKVYYGSPYHTEFIEEYEPIIPGEVNVRNMDAWLPVKIKLNLQVRNNNYSSLLVANKILKSDYSSFPQASIFEQNKDTIVYLDSKPNSSIELNFHYTTGYTNNDYHSRSEIIQTTLQDTIAFSFQIDCATF